MIDNELTYSISEVSERLKLSHRTLHYYEQYFNIPIRRDDGGNRRYTEENVAILELIVDLKQKDMSLKGIKKMLQERNMLPVFDDNLPIVVDDNIMEFKEFFMFEIRKLIMEELAATNEKLDRVLQENEELKNELKVLMRQSEDHYSKIDSQIREWRSRQPWYKRIFKKE